MKTKVNALEQDFCSSGEDEDGFSPLQDSSLGDSGVDYDRTNWAKACYQHKMKRIRSPPNTYEELIEALKVRFQDLRELLDSDKQRRVQLSYLDKGGELMEIEDSSDLVQAIRQSKKEYQVLRFLIETYLKEGEGDKTVLSEKLESEEGEEDN